MNTAPARKQLVRSVIIGAAVVIIILGLIARKLL